MNEEEFGRLSQKIADAPVPESVQNRLRQARQAALAHGAQSMATRGGWIALVLSYPKFALTSLALLLAIGLAVLQQQRSQPDAAIDIALLSSDVPMEMLLDAAMLEAQEQ
ncbi:MULTISPECIES: DUF3619 family protein [Deefgea]|uniref:DUF3619 family protein n=1 Tax=Deefgea chitinilytica TaxID=570276 RepID=A0ABS2CED9_9NEIS|nr:MULTISPECIES: DUF3619 family protein [Deefgea]MBM5572507.1 DUF3619 family protein [Deefgea chitinilytica]MBM9889743.1 DUF3619 family protein [Deefgea sp. CFH1-16]